VKCQRCGQDCESRADCLVNLALIADGVSPEYFRNPEAPPLPPVECGGSGAHFLVLDIGLYRYHGRHAVASDPAALVPCADYVIATESRDGIPAGYLVDLSADDPRSAGTGPWDAFKVPGDWTGTAASPAEGIGLIHQARTAIGHYIPEGDR
jgi:hypothetical protein